MPPVGCLYLNRQITNSYVRVSGYICSSLINPIPNFRYGNERITKHKHLCSFSVFYPLQMISFRHRQYGRIPHVTYRNSLHIYLQTRVSCKDLVVYLSLYENPQRVIYFSSVIVANGSLSL